MQTDADKIRLQISTLVEELKKAQDPHRRRKLQYKLNQLRVHLPQIELVNVKCDEVLPDDSSKKEFMAVLERERQQPSDSDKSPDDQSIKKVRKSDSKDHFSDFSERFRKILSKNTGKVSRVRKHQQIDSSDPQWPNIYSFLPSLAAKNFKGLMIGKYDNCSFRIFPDIFQPLLWKILSISFSEIKHRFPEIDIEAIDTLAFNSHHEPHIIPVQAINKCRAILLEKDKEYITRPVMKGGKKIKEFIARTYIMRTLVISGANHHKIVEIINATADKFSDNPEQLVIKCVEISRNHNLQLSKKDCSPDKFLQLVSTLRNWCAHGKTSFSHSNDFNFDIFEAAVMPSFKSAIVDWLSSESWLEHLAIATLVNAENKEYYFELDRPSQEVIIIPQSDVLIPLNSMHIINTANHQYLFTFHNLRNGEQ